MRFNLSSGTVDILLYMVSELRANHPPHCSSTKASSMRNVQASDVKNHTINTIDRFKVRAMQLSTILATVSLRLMFESQARQQAQGPAAVQTDMSS